MASYVLVPFNGSIVDTPNTQLSGYTNSGFVSNRQQIWKDRDDDIISKPNGTTIPRINFKLLDKNGETAYKRYSSYRVRPHQRKVWRAVYNDNGEEIDRVWVQGSIAYPHDVRLDSLSKYQWEMNPTEQRYPSSFWNDDVYDDRFAPQVYRSDMETDNYGLNEGFYSQVSNKARTYWHDPSDNRIRVYDETKIPSHTQGEPDWVQAQEPYVNGVGAGDYYTFYNDPDNEDDDTGRYLGRPDEYNIPQRYDEDEDGDILGSNTVWTVDRGSMYLHTGCGVDIPNYTDKFILANTFFYRLGNPPQWGLLDPDFVYNYGLAYPNLWITWFNHYPDNDDIATKVKFKLNGVTGIRGIKSSTTIAYKDPTKVYSYYNYSDFSLAQENHSYQNSVGNQGWNAKPIFGIWHRFDTYEVNGETFSSGVNPSIHTTINTSSGTNWNVSNYGLGGGKPRNAEWIPDEPDPPNSTYISYGKHLENGGGYYSYIYDMTNGYKPMITDFNWGRPFIL